MYDTLSSGKKFSYLPLRIKVFRLLSLRRADSIHQNVSGKVCVYNLDTFS